MNPYDHPLWKNPRGLVSPRRQVLDKLIAASQYASMQMADAATRAEYESRVTKKQNAYALAVTDFLSPPRICSVSLEQYTGRAGELITLHVVDDFKVAGVRLELLDSGCTPFEQGEAREDGKELWRYKTKRTIPPFGRITLVVTAYDIPGNTDQQTIHLLLAKNSAVTRLNIEL
jgi:hypothetical protein